MRIEDFSTLQIHPSIMGALLKFSLWINDPSRGTCEKQFAAMLSLKCERELFQEIELRKSAVVYRLTKSLPINKVSSLGRKLCIALCILH